MAGLDRRGADRHRNLAALQAQQGASLRDLAALLTPLHDAPESLAARLLSRFGTIGRLAQASEAELWQSAFPGEKWVSALVGVRRLLNAGVREKMMRSRFGRDRRSLFSYLLITMQHLAEERMVAIFADAEGFVLAEEILAEGDQVRVLVTPRAIFGRAMKVDARRILLAHNHPSGNPEPSHRDIEHTRSLCRQAGELGLLIEDHLVVGARDVMSMRDRGYI